MPKGFKLELNDILQKEQEEKNKPHVHKKHRKGFTFSSDTYRNRKKDKSNDTNKNNTYYNDNKQSIQKSLMTDTPKKSSRISKQLSKDDYNYSDKEYIKNKSNPFLTEVSKQCEKGMNKIKRNVNSQDFYYSSNKNVQSLSQIEKNIKTFKYKTVYEFIMDLRRIWCYYFSEPSEIPDIYAKTCEMSKLCEKIYREIEVDFKDNRGLTEINKKIDNLSKEVKEIQGNVVVQHNSLMNSKRYSSNNERPLSRAETETLRKNIQSLTDPQKQELIRMISDNVENSDKNCVEIHLNTIPIKVQRELDRFVKNCVKKNMNAHNQHLMNYNNVNRNHNSSMNGNRNNKEMNDIEKLKNGLEGTTLRQNINMNNINNSGSNQQQINMNNKFNNNSNINSNVNASKQIGNVNNNNNNIQKKKQNNNIDDYDDEDEDDSISSSEPDSSSLDS